MTITNFSPFMTKSELYELICQYLRMCSTRFVKVPTREEFDSLLTFESVMPPNVKEVAERLLAFLREVCEEQPAVTEFAAMLAKLEPAMDHLAEDSGIQTVVAVRKGLDKFLKKNWKSVAEAYQEHKKNDARYFKLKELQTRVNFGPAQNQEVCRARKKFLDWCSAFDVHPVIFSLIRAACVSWLLSNGKGNQKRIARGLISMSAGNPDEEENRLGVSLSNLPRYLCFVPVYDAIARKMVCLSHMHFHVNGNVMTRCIERMVDGMRKVYQDLTTIGKVDDYMRKEAEYTVRTARTCVKAAGDIVANPDMSDEDKLAVLQAQFGQDDTPDMQVYRDELDRIKRDCHDLDSLESAMTRMLNDVRSHRNVRAGSTDYALEDITRILYSDTIPSESKIQRLLTSVFNFKKYVAAKKTLSTIKASDGREVSTAWLGEMFVSAHLNWKEYFAAVDYDIEHRGQICFVQESYALKIKRMTNLVPFLKQSLTRIQQSKNIKAAC